MPAGPADPLADRNTTMRKFAMTDRHPTAQTADPTNPPIVHRADDRSRRRRWIISVFGDITRSGSWTPRRTLSPVAIFGDIDLDFRHATLPAGDVTINAIAPCGSVDVLVPAGTNVDVGGFALFGSKKVAVQEGDPAASATLVRVRVFTLLGSLKVWSP
jgi:hypothetical protein